MNDNALGGEFTRFTHTGALTICALAFVSTLVIAGAAVVPVIPEIDALGGTLREFGVFAGYGFRAVAGRREVFTGPGREANGLLALVVGTHNNPECSHRRAGFEAAFDQ
jgi:hypothetical protein